MDSLHFPMYSYRTFSKEEIEYNKIEEYSDIIRYDYFDFTKISFEDRYKFTEKLLSRYDDIESKGFEYNDFMTHRYFFKEFVLREIFEDKSLYVKYYLSDWNKVNKDKEYDDRMLIIDIYMQDGDIFYRVFSYKIKIGHKDDIIKYLQYLDDKCEKDTSLILSENLYVLPLYISVHKSEYVRISDLYKKFDRSKLDHSMIYSACTSALRYIRLFSLLNFYMIDKVENNEEFDFLDNGNIVSNTLTTYISKKAVKDKTVVIDMGNKIRLRIKPKRDNIYNHNNHTLRSLCDYKFQVSAHYHTYWIGSKKNNTRRKIKKWVESYFKNADKEFNIIKKRINL